MRRVGWQFRIRDIMTLAALVAIVLAAFRYFGRGAIGVVVSFLLYLGGAYFMRRDTQRGRPRVDRESGDLKFGYGGGIRFAAISLATLILGGFGLLVYKHPFKDVVEALGICLLLGIFLFAPFGFLVWEVTRFSIVVSSRGLDYQSSWRPGFLVAWQDVTEVRYEPAMGWFVIRSRQRQTINVPKYIAGIGEFVNELKWHLDPSGNKDPVVGLFLFKCERKSLDDRNHSTSAR